MATHFSILAWRIPWTEEAGGLQSMASQRVRHNSAQRSDNCVLGRWLVPLETQSKGADRGPSELCRQRRTDVIPEKPGWVRGQRSFQLWAATANTWQPEPSVLHVCDDLF